jgi:hypothetical protein
MAGRGLDATPAPDQRPLAKDRTTDDPAAGTPPKLFRVKRPDDDPLRGDVDATGASTGEPNWPPGTNAYRDPGSGDSGPPDREAPPQVPDSEESRLLDRSFVCAMVANVRGGIAQLRQVSTPMIWPVTLLPISSRATSTRASSLTQRTGSTASREPYKEDGVPPRDLL